VAAGHLLTVKDGVDGVRLFKTATCFLIAAGWRPDRAAISAVGIPSCKLFLQLKSLFSYPSLSTAPKTGNKSSEEINKLWQIMADERLK
jgi:hypothetical protein